MVNLTPPSGPADMDTGLDEADVPLVDKPEKSKKSSKKKKKRRGTSYDIADERKSVLCR